MGKNPGRFERPKRAPKAQTQARKELRAAHARIAIAAHEEAAEAIAKNRERLKAERLAREAGAMRTPKRD
jgi:hypothetical protein